MSNLRALLGCMALFCVMPASAQNADSAIQQIMASPAALEQARSAGRKVAMFCANCHGENGTSNYDYIPNLAGQHPAYLLEQIRKFADGRRQDDFMTGMIKIMSEQERINIALFYAGQQVQNPKAKTNPLAARGKSLFLSICTACHGATGHGNERFARLAGQHSAYIVQSLKQYRQGDGNRKDPVMGSVARRLNDKDIEAVAAYIQSMP